MRLRFRNSDNHINFIGIGAQKSGTSWLYARLNELEEFSLPPIKELHYFDRFSTVYGKSNLLQEASLQKRLINLKWTKTALNVLFKNRKDSRKFRWLIKWYFSNYNESWYLSLFDNCKGITGEISPSYAAIDKDGIKRMHDLVPHVKIIFIIRNPIERAWSQYRSFISEREPLDKEWDRYKSSLSVKGSNSLIDSVGTLEDEKIIQFLNHDFQHLRSSYIQTLENYVKYYKKEQILIGFFDAIEEQPKQFLKEIVGFVGGNEKMVTRLTNLDLKTNVSYSTVAPEKISLFLKKKYQSLIAELSDKFGGYCSKWYIDNYETDSSTIEVSPILKCTLNLNSVEL